VKDDNGDLHADSHNILNRWKNYFSQLLNVRRASDVRQIEISIAKLKRYKSPGSDQIRAKLIQAGGEILHSKIHELINSIWNMENLPDQWKESIIIPVHKKADQTDCTNYRGISLLSTLYKFFSNILLSRLSPYADEIIGDHQCEF
jgi:hypothetical protein